MFLGYVENTTSATVCRNSVFAKLSGCRKWGFRIEDCIFCFVFFMLLQDKQKNTKKWKQAKNPLKIVFFKVVIQKWERWKRLIFSKKCLTRFVSGREKKVHFRAHYLFRPKIFWAQNSEKPGKTIKMVVSTENAQNLKRHLFWKKVFFGMVEKSVFTNCVFWKAVFPWKHCFIVFSVKHSSCSRKNVCWNNRKFMKNSGLFLNVAEKGVFCLFSFRFQCFCGLFLCVW